MKKNLFLVLAVVIAVVFNSCSKDEDDSKDDQSLNNTTWEMSNHGTHILLSFTSDIAKFTKTGEINRITMYKYTYSDNRVTFIPIESWTVQLYGTISNNVMKVENPTITEGSQIIYTLNKTK